MKFPVVEIYDFLQRLFWLAVVLWLAFTVGQAINKNYQSNRKISQLKQDINDLKTKIERQKLLNIYYQSDTFKELEARKRLGLKKPDEKVFILPKKDQDQSQVTPGQTKVEKKSQRPEPNPRKWLQFLLGV